jgi:hypothetical protein
MLKRILSFIAVIVLVQTGLAQSHRASVRGLVTDSSGAALPEATIRITNETTDETRATTTAPDGRFAVPVLPPGAYRVEVERSGYRSMSSVPTCRSTRNCGSMCR